jgi:hypothetical protein
MRKQMMDLFIGSAATYLGVTCEGRSPELLEPLRPHFGDRADWQTG